MNFTSKMKLGLVILATSQASLFESYNALIAVRNALTLCEIEGIKGRESKLTAK